jgi:hypothetical protein
MGSGRFVDSTTPRGFPGVGAGTTAAAFLAAIISDSFISGEIVSVSPERHGGRYDHRFAGGLILQVRQRQCRCIEVPIDLIKRRN